MSEESARLDHMLSKTLQWRKAPRIDKLRRCLQAASPQDRLSLAKRQEKDGFTVLHCLSYHGHQEQVRAVLQSILTKERIDLLEIPNKRGCTALHLAALRGFTGVAKCMLDSLASQPDRQLELLRVVNCRQQTALETAAAERNADTAQSMQEYVESAEARSQELSIRERDRGALQEEFDRKFGALEEFETQQIQMVNDLSNKCLLLENKLRVYESLSGSYSLLQKENPDKDRKIKELEAMLACLTGRCEGLEMHLQRQQEKYALLESKISDVKEDIELRHAPPTNQPLETETTELTCKPVQEQKQSDGAERPRQDTILRLVCPVTGPGGRPSQ